MNKKERDRLCGIIAGWEWGTSGGTSSEAAAYASVCRTLKDDFNLTDEDLLSHRAYELWRTLGYADAGDDAAYDAIYDLVETRYDDLCTMDTRELLQSVIEAAKE